MAFELQVSCGCLLKGSGLQVGNLQVSWCIVRMAFEPQVVNLRVLWLSVEGFGAASWQPTGVMVHRSHRF